MICLGSHKGNTGVVTGVIAAAYLLVSVEARHGDALEHHGQARLLDDRQHALEVRRQVVSQVLVPVQRHARGLDRLLHALPSRVRSSAC